MPYHIYGKIQNQVIAFVGCSSNADIPKDSIVLQVVEHHPEFQWVKWCVRCRRTLKDRTGLDHRYAKYFRNPSRLKRLQGDDEFERISAKENAAFLRFNQRNLHVLEDFLEAALAKKKEGRDTFSAGDLIGQIRWGKSKTDRGADRFKVNDRWVPYYSRVAQMLEPDLLGFFEIRASIADGLVWTDESSWEQFASENSEKLKWTEASDELPDGDWEYSE